MHENVMPLTPITAGIVNKHASAPRPASPHSLTVEKFTQNRPKRPILSKFLDSQRQQQRLGRWGGEAGTGMQV